VYNVRLVSFVESLLKMKDAGSQPVSAPSFEAGSVAYAALVKDLEAIKKQLECEKAERIRVEKCFHEAERRYSHIVETVAEGIYQSTPDGKFIAVNSAFAKMLGYESPQDLLGTIRNIKDQLYVNPHVREEFKKQLAETNVIRGMEYEVYRKDGARIWITVNAHAVCEENGSVLYYEGTTEDITPRKKSEKQLQIINERLRKHVVELARSNTELQQFASAASHDLQEPLRMVASYVKLLQERYSGKLDRDADDFIGFAVEGVNRMKLLIDDLLTLSKVGRGDVNRGPTSFVASLQQALGNLELAIKEGGAVISFDPLPVLEVDQVQICQLFQNLIGNAIKFRGTAPPKIHISAEKRDSEWVFSVKDNGIGFEMEYAHRIFRMFQRLHARNDYSGNGVGLAICKKIVEMYGGKIWVKSKPGIGSQFFFTLPLNLSNASRSRDDAMRLDD